MTKAVIYARYSSDLQSENSIEDQVRLCRERAEREGIDVVDVFADFATSGGNLGNRPGMLSLLEAAKNQNISVVITEALDRISRDQEDIAAIFKRLDHADVKIITLSEGEVNELHIGLKGTMNALFLKDLAAKVRRGQRGRVEAQRAAGGLSYGYRVIREIGPDHEIERGRREINEEEAEVIRRIFDEYVSGRSPRAIAGDLNREKIPSPRGGTWNASTINGHRSRLHGILLNPLYVGQMIYGRVTYRKNPDSGARELRVVPEKDWVRIEVPEWQIVSKSTWDAAQRLRLKNTLHGPHIARRPRHLFSGLIRCGVCNGAYTMRSSDRLGCVAHREKATCSNCRTIKLVELERRILSGLKNQMLSSEHYSTFAEEFRAEIQRLSIAQSNLASDLQESLIDTSGRIERIVDAIAGGTASKSLVSKLAYLEDEREIIEAQIRELETAPEYLELSPNLPDLYRSKVADLESDIRENSVDHAEAKQIIRSLVDRIVVYPGQRRGETEIEVFGSLADILEITGECNQEDSAPKSVVKVVPRGGIEPPTP